MRRFVRKGLIGRAALLLGVVCLVSGCASSGSARSEIGELRVPSGAKLVYHGPASEVDLRHLDFPGTLYVVNNVNRVVFAMYLNEDPGSPGWQPPQLTADPAVAARGYTVYFSAEADRS